MNTNIVGEFSQSETKMCFVSGGHRHIISPFYVVLKETKRSLGSHTFQIGDHSWQIVCYPGGETADVKDWVSLFLGYRGPEKECFAHWRLTLVNQKDPSQSRSRAWLKGDKFNKFMIGRRWGWQRFIKREDLMNPDKGFIKDNTVIFEASLDVFVKQTLTMVFEDKFDFNLYPIPATQIETDFGFLFNEGKLDPNDNKASGALADVKFVLEDGSFQYAHSQILSARSPVFFKLFTSAFKEANQPDQVVTIPLVGMSRVTLIETLRYIYTGRVDWEGVKKTLTVRTKRRSSEFVSSLCDLSTNSEFQPLKKTKCEDAAFSKSVDSPCTDEEGKPLPQSAQTFCSPDAMIMFNSPSEYEKERSATIHKIKKEMEFLKFALSLYEAADKYELNRLRLIGEHKALEVLREQVNRINRDVMYTQRFLKYPMSQYVSSYGTPSQLFNTPKAPKRLPVHKHILREHLDLQKENEEIWCNGFLDVLAVADRHNSRRLKRLCLSALTSDSLCKRTKRILLSNSFLSTLSKELITEMLQYVAIREQRVVDEERGMPEFGVLGGVPEGGKELLDEKEADVLDGQEEREPSAMQESELRSELVERGFPIRGNRAVLVERLEEARGMRIFFERKNRPRN